MVVPPAGGIVFVFVFAVCVCSTALDVLRGRDVFHARRGSAFCHLTGHGDVFVARRLGVSLALTCDIRTWRGLGRRRGNLGRRGSRDRIGERDIDLLGKSRRRRVAYYKSE
jgi:hypothetical protein